MPCALSAETPRCVRRLFLAMGQYSSFCVSAVVFTLGGEDIEDGVLDREQVECGREEVEEGEKQKRDKTKRQRPLKHVTSWMTCRWRNCAPETP